MKKSIKWVLAVLGVVVAGVVVGWASGSPNGIHVSEGAKYQYQLINPDDIIIEYSGLKPDSKLSNYKGKYVTDTAMYLSDEVGVYLGDEHFKAKVGEYIKYSDINWTWNLSDFEMYQLMNSQGEASPSLFKGVVVYSDGTEGDISADRVTLEPSADGSQIVVGVWFRDDIFYYKINIQERWGDGESLSEEEKETFKQEGSSTSGDSTGLSAEKITYSTAADVYASDDYAYIYELVLKDKSLDKSTRIVFEEDLYEMVKDMEEWGNLNEFRKFTSLEDFYSFFDEMYAPYGLDRAHRDETNKEAQEKLNEMGGLPLDGAVTFETNESDDSWLEGCVFTVGDTIMFNPKDTGGLIDEEFPILQIIGTTPTGETFDAGRFSASKELGWDIPEKGTVFNYSQYVEFTSQYMELIKKNE